MPTVRSNGHSSHVLMFAVGSLGDVLPVVAVGAALRQRGHDVLIATNPYFEPVVTKAGLGFAALGSRDEYLRTLQDDELWRMGTGVQIFLQRILPYMRDTYRLIADQYIPRQTVVVAPSSAFGARLAHEKLGVPLVSLHLQPLVLRSVYEQPGLTIPRVLKPIVPPLRRAWLSYVDRKVLDPLVLAEINGFRADLGLRPVQRPFNGWTYSPQLIVGLFPEWFAPRQADWPQQLHLTGFPLYDGSDAKVLSSDLDEFLNAGDRPIVFTCGTAMRHGTALFQVSVDACQRLGRRAILLTPFREQLPTTLPASVRHVDYAPLGALLRRSLALVHHGGIGTTAQALRAGIPQVLTPFAFDQPDNAARVKRLGVGDVIWPRRYTTARVMRRLDRLLSSPRVEARCQALAGRFGGTDAIIDTCRLIESVRVSAH